MPVWAVQKVLNDFHAPVAPALTGIVQADQRGNNEVHLYLSQLPKIHQFCAYQMAFLTSTTV